MRSDGGRVEQYNFMFFYTYVLRGLNDKKLYIGWTDNLKARFIKHNKGEVVATKNRRPLKLIYYEACLNKEKAIAREKYFKTGFGRKFLKSRI
jgi:putative endonuclease